jgi:starch synthase
MKVLFVTSEVATVYKLGGLGDVSYSLPAALKRLGVDVRVAMPYYVRAKLHKPAKCVGPLAVSWDGRRELVFVFEGRLADTHVPLLLFRHPILNEYRGDKEMDSATRFAFFCQAVATFITVEAMKGERFDIIHCNDWHTSLLPLLLGESPKVFFRNGHAHAAILPRETLAARAVRSILTIHNPAYHGTTGKKLIKKIALSARQFHVLGDGGRPYINLLREGIAYADMITTVSPTFAKEMLGANYGPHVTAILKKRKDRLIGIINGLDDQLWKPDYHIRNAQNAKKEIKSHLRETLGLPDRAVPVFGFVGRLDRNQKGLDILLPAVQEFLKRGAIQLVLLGTGAPAVVREIENIAAEYRDAFAFVHTFDERLARRIYAGSDCLLVPSKYEPCGLTQMIAMRYGTIPLVRKTGGLADTVDDSRTGFVFDRYSAEALGTALSRVIACWHDPGRWVRMMASGMREDFSWNRSARMYRALYNQLASAS